MISTRYLRPGLLRESLILALVSTLSPAVLAQPLPALPGVYRQIDFENGGYVTGIFGHTPSGTLYARTDIGGVYRSDDAAKNWIFLGGPFTSKAALFTAGVAIPHGSLQNPDGKIVYIGVGDRDTRGKAPDVNAGVWKSTNGGNTWSQILNKNMPGNAANMARDAGECLVLDPDNAGTLFAGTFGEGLWRSLNANQADPANISFTEIVNVKNSVNEFSNLNISSIHLPGNGEVWVGGESATPGRAGLWISTQNGDSGSWTKIELPIPTIPVSSRRVLSGATVPNTLPEGADGQLFLNMVRRIVKVVAPLGDSTTGDALYYSATFARKELDGDRDVHNYTYHGVYRIRLKAGADAQKWKNPANLEFDDLTEVLADVRLSNVASVRGSPKTNLVLLRSGRLLVGDRNLLHALENPAKKEVSAFTWTTIPMTLAPKEEYTYPNWMSETWLGAEKPRRVSNHTLITEDPVNANVWYSASGFAVAVSRAEGSFKVGDKWTYTTQGMGEAVPGRIAFHPTNPDIIYVPFTDLGGAVVTDGGRSGKSQYKTIIGSFEVDQNNAALQDYLATCFGVIVKADGTPWFIGRQQQNGSSPMRLYPRLYTTANLGASWSRNAPVYFTGSYPIKDVSQSVIQSLPALNGTLPLGILADAVMNRQNENAYAVVSMGPRFQNINNPNAGNINVTEPNGAGVYYTADNGATFQRANVPLDIDRDASTGGVQYREFMFANGGIHSGTGKAVFYLAVRFRGIYVSTDDGANWSKVAQPFVSSSLESLRIAADVSPNRRRLWAAGGVPSGQLQETGIAYSDNDGATWNTLLNPSTSVRTFSSALDVTALNGVVAVVGRRNAYTFGSQSVPADTYNRVYLSFDDGGTWVPVTDSVRPYGGNATWLALSPHVPGQVWFSVGGRSLAVFTPDELPSQLTDPDNIVANASFAATTPTTLSSWGAYSANVSRQPGGVEGAWNLRLGPLNGVVTQFVPLRGAATIRYKFWASTTADNSQASKLRWADGQSTYLGTDYVTAVNARNWAEYDSGNLVPPTGATKALIMYYRQPGGPSGFLNVDHVQVTPNLLVNPGFETPLSSATDWSMTGTVVRNTGSAAEGVGYVRLAGTASITQTRPVSPRPTTVKITLKARITNGGGVVRYSFNGGTASVAISLPASTGGWQSYSSASLVVPSTTTQITVSAQGVNGGTLDIDDLQLVPSYY